MAVTVPILCQSEHFEPHANVISFVQEAFNNREATHEVRVSGANRESSATSPSTETAILSSFLLVVTMRSLHDLEQDVRDTCIRTLMFVPPSSYTAV